MTFKRFNKLTQDEFILMQGSEKITQMIGNKYYTDDTDVIDFLEEHAIGQWCPIKHRKGFIIYFESTEDVTIVRQYLEPNSIGAPPVHSINIAHEYK